MKRPLSDKKREKITEDPRFQARIAKFFSIIINDHYDIPFVSAINEAGTVVYIDKHFPLEGSIAILHAIKMSEIAKKAAQDIFNVEYAVAEQVGMYYERRTIESVGYDWGIYCERKATYVKQLNEVVVLPEDIDLVRYLGDPKEVKLLRSKMVKEQNKKTAKEKLGLTETKISLQYHAELNPKLWNNFQLIPAVRDRLLSLGYMWAEYTHIPKQIIIDVYMTGGNANYNYTPTSDIDVHVVISKEVLGFPKEFMDDYLQDKKKIWSLDNHITVKGYPIELYAQDVGEGIPANQGVYSLLRNQWVQQPTRLQLDFSKDKFLKRKVIDYVHQIDALIKSNASLQDFKQLRTRLKDMRGAAIAAGGEFSFENLVFKELRNRGYLDKINKYTKKLKEKELSL